MKDSGVSDTLKTLAILNALSSGIDPLTGVPFPRDSAYQHPAVIRALFQALRAFEGTMAPAAQPKAATSERKKAARPAAAGTLWSAEEDARLASAFDSGTDIEALALIHDRSRFAIETRLAKLGRIPAPTGMRHPVRPERAPKVSEPLLRYAA